MIIKCHIILIKNLTESFNESSDENFVALYFNLVAQNYHDNTDQNSHYIAEFYSFFLNSR